MSENKIEVVLQLDGGVSPANVKGLDLNAALAALSKELSKLPDLPSKATLRLELELIPDKAVKSPDVRIAGLKSYIWSSRTL